MSITTLRDALFSERLILFFGADLPISLTGLPSRTDLAAGLAQQRGLQANLSLAATAQRIMQGGNRFIFTDYLIRQLDTLGMSPQHIHELVRRLSVKVIITTAYDNLLELAFARSGKPINRVVRDNDLAFADPHNCTLIKLYGDLQQRDTLIVTEDDHYGLWRNREKESVLDEVRRAMRGNAVLFLGYNLADPDFLLLWREVLDRMGRFALGAYALHSGIGSDERRVWEERHLQILDHDPLTLLEQLIVSSNGGSTQASNTPVPVTNVLQHQKNLPKLTDETIATQQKLLATHRRTLATLVEQEAKHTSAYVPPSIVHGIIEARSHIRHIKKFLRDSGVVVDDQPSDVDESVSDA